MNGAPLEKRTVSPHVVQYASQPQTSLSDLTAECYVVRFGSECLVVDCTDDDCAMAMVDDARVQGERITALWATHAHIDHIRGFRTLCDVTGLPLNIHKEDGEAALQVVAGHQMQAWDEEFIEWTLDTGHVSIHHAPGHTKGHVHICIPDDGVILVGDHLSEAGTVWIGPPEGHLASYLAALESIEEAGCSLAGPGHGRVIPDAVRAAQVMRSRRNERTDQILALIRTGPMTVDALAIQLYGRRVPPEHWWAAQKTVEGHLIYLMEQGLVDATRENAAKGFAYVCRSM